MAKKTTPAKKTVAATKNGATKNKKAKEESKKIVKSAPVVSTQPKERVVKSSATVPVAKKSETKSANSDSKKTETMAPTVESKKTPVPEKKERKQKPKRTTARFVKPRTKNPNAPGNVTFLPPVAPANEPPITYLSTSNNAAPVTNIGWHSGKEGQISAIDAAIKLHEQSRQPQSKNVTYIAKNTGPVNQTEAGQILNAISEQIFAYCNRATSPPSWRVVDYIRSLNPNVAIEAKHPGNGHKRQSKFIISLDGQSVECPKVGFYTTSIS